MPSNTTPFELIVPKTKKTPFILSIPHCGIAFPNELKNTYNQSLISAPDDTDWFLEILYDFAEDMGITIIKAVYSRWVIDLNRTPENQSLYNDGRIITSLCPTTDFLGKPLYLSKEHEPNAEEIQRRLKTYYWPYHNKIDMLLEDCKASFGKALLWDAHSIRRHVETIQKKAFPDLILGNNDLQTANKPYVDTALKHLGSGPYKITHNTPFKGGYITRSKGNPAENIHALQLEMCKDLYMSSKETIYDVSRAATIKKMLKNTFNHLIHQLNA
ncbi:MAG: N-formylglutamate amidohydrolase [Crocinitomicaceae bacterium]|nr:N-formylglutamate amidohydrolase [Crocinitomicaceae bacterium]